MGWHGVCFCGVCEFKHFETDLRLLMIMNHMTAGVVERDALPGSVPMRPSGSYEVRIPVDRADLMREIEEGRSAYVVIGSVLPVRSGAELCRLLESDDGRLQYPVYLLRSSDPGKVENPLDKVAAKVMATGPLHPSLQQQIDASAPWGEVIHLHDLEIHIDQRDVLLKGKPIHLTASEFDLLSLLAKRIGWVLSRQDIIKSLRGCGSACTPRNVDVLIVGLRRKLESVGSRIQTVRGIGYRLRA